jgi:DUF177 domain-containing protein
MLFNVSGLIQEGIGATRHHKVEGVLESDELDSEPVCGDVELITTRAGVLVRAHLRLEASGSCSRCLKPLIETIPIDFEEEFHATVDIGGKPVPADGDQEAFLIDEHHLLDLTEAVRQYREASAVMQPLCRPDCKGLCPRCGRDLNAGACDCAQGPADARWAALSDLLPDTEGKD